MLDTPSGNGSSSFCNRKLLHSSSSDWRDHRSKQDPKHLIDRLEDIAPEYERLKWDVNLLIGKKDILQKFLLHITSSNNLEDFLDLYKVLDQSFNWTTPLEHIEQAVKAKKSWY